MLGSLSGMKIKAASEGLCWNVLNQERGMLEVLDKT
jgi:hypothetical protein